MWQESGGYLTNVVVYDSYFGPGYGSEATAGLNCEGSGLLAYNNIFDGSDGSSPANAMLKVSVDTTRPTSYVVVNNTFIANYSSISAVASAVNTHWTILNNLFSTTTGSEALDFLAYGGVLFNGILSSDYNCFTGFAPLNNVAYVSSTGYLTWGQWRTAGYDAHGSNTSPNLNGSFVPQTGSSLIGAGTNLYSTFTADYAGNARPSSGGWTIGARCRQHQYVSNHFSHASQPEFRHGCCRNDDQSKLYGAEHRQRHAHGQRERGCAIQHRFRWILQFASGAKPDGYGQLQSYGRGTNGQSVTFTGASGGSGAVSGTAAAPPVVSIITMNGADVDTSATGLQIFAASVVQYSCSASDPNGLPVSWQWNYTVNGGPATVVQSGTGPVASVSFNYTASMAGNTYVWMLLASNSYSAAKSTLTVGVEAPPLAAANLTFQAGDGVVTAPFVLTNGYLSQSVQTTDPTTGGEAVFTFTITNAGALCHPSAGQCTK